MGNIIVRRSGRPRFRRGPRPDLRWSADSFVFTLAAQAVPVALRAAFVSKADYDFSGGAVEPTGATVESIRMNIILCSPRVRIPAVMPNAGVDMLFGISRHDIDDAAVVPGGHADVGVVAEQVDEDWLWLGHGAVADDPAPRYQQLNLKVRRKLKDQVLSFHASSAVTGAGTGSWEGMVQVRTLLRFAKTA